MLFNNIKIILLILLILHNVQSRPIYSTPSYKPLEMTFTTTIATTIATTLSPSISSSISPTISENVTILLKNISLSNSTGNRSQSTTGSIISSCVAVGVIIIFFGSLIFCKCDRPGGCKC